MRDQDQSPPRQISGHREDDAAAAASTFAVGHGAGSCWAAKLHGRAALERVPAAARQTRPDPGRPGHEHLEPGRLCGALRRDAGLRAVRVELRRQGEEAAALVLRALGRSNVGRVLVRSHHQRLPALEGDWLRQAPPCARARAGQVHAELGSSRAERDCQQDLRLPATGAGRGGAQLRL